MCFLNVHALYKHTYVQFSTCDMDGFFHSSLSCPSFSLKNTHKGENLTAQFDSPGFALSNLLTTAYASSCRQRCSYGIAVASHPFLPVLTGAGWCRLWSKVLQSHLKEGKKRITLHILAVYCSVSSVSVREQYHSYQVNVFEFATVQSHCIFLVLLEGQTQSQRTEQGC